LTFESGWIKVTRQPGGVTGPAGRGAGETFAALAVGVGPGPEAPRGGGKSIFTLSKRVAGETLEAGYFFAFTFFKPAPAG